MIPNVSVYQEFCCNKHFFNPQSQLRVIDTRKLQRRFELWRLFKAVFAMLCSLFNSYNNTLHGLHFFAVFKSFDS